VTATCSFIIGFPPWFLDEVFLMNIFVHEVEWDSNVFLLRVPPWFLVEVFSMNIFWSTFS
jgi:hypothetical protein